MRPSWATPGLAVVEWSHHGVTETQATACKQQSCDLNPKPSPLSSLSPSSSSLSSCISPCYVAWAGLSLRLLCLSVCPSACLFLSLSPSYIAHVGLEVMAECMAHAQPQTQAASWSHCKFSPFPLLFLLGCSPWDGAAVCIQGGIP